MFVNDVKCCSQAVCSPFSESAVVGRLKLRRRVWYRLWAVVWSNGCSVQLQHLWWRRRWWWTFRYPSSSGACIRVAWWWTVDWWLSERSLVWLLALSLPRCVIYIHVPVSPSSVIRNWSNGGDALSSVARKVRCRSDLMLAWHHHWRVQGQTLGANNGGLEAEPTAGSRDIAPGQGARRRPLKLKAFLHLYNVRELANLSIFFAEQTISSDVWGPWLLPLESVSDGFRGSVCITYSLLYPLSGKRQMSTSLMLRPHNNDKYSEISVNSLLICILCVECVCSLITKDCQQSVICHLFVF